MAERCRPSWRREPACRQRLAGRAARGAAGAVASAAPAAGARRRGRRAHRDDRFLPGAASPACPKGGPGAAARRRALAAARRDGRTLVMRPAGRDDAPAAARSEALAAAAARCWASSSRWSWLFRRRFARRLAGRAPRRRAGSEALKQNVEALGGGASHPRVARTATTRWRPWPRVSSNQPPRASRRWWAHPPHVCQSTPATSCAQPLARMKMALALPGDVAPADRERLRMRSRSASANSTRWSRMVLLMSRLDAAPPDTTAHARVDLFGLVAEEAHFDAELADAGPVAVDGDEASAAPRVAQPARERLAPRRRRDAVSHVSARRPARSCASATVGRRRPRGRARAHLRVVLPPARPIRSRAGGVNCSLPRQADRRAPRRPRAARARRRREAASSSACPGDRAVTGCRRWQAASGIAPGLEGSVLCLPGGHQAPRVI